ncbi:hypothetical protein BX600DRAFT_100027 [Xylariales sp. PMI_506]|nr:hypothetical protein BX600DRAFT_100027 [Xylariales sp. PMI_506]
MTNRQRVGHKKSRHGCIRCKARRVKCDEQRPCSNCVRHRTPCSLSQEPLAAALDYGGALASLSTVGSDLENPLPAVRTKLAVIADLLREVNAGVAAISSSKPSTPAFESPASGGGGAGPHGVPPPDWMQSVRIFHYYCTTVSTTLAIDSTTENLWKTAVPELACSHEPLMNGLLAITSLYYAQLHPEERKEYMIMSTNYQNLALHHFATQLNDINEDNCEANFLLATFIFLFSACSIAHAHNQDQDHRPEAITAEEVAQSFVLLQGARNLKGFSSISRWKEQGPLSMLMRPWEPSAGSEHAGPFLKHLDKLSCLVRELPPSVDVINERSACVLALESLRTMYGWFAVEVCSNTAARTRWIWPMTLPALFHQLISDCHPVSLIILVHYAALVRPFENPSWALGGWSASVLSMVERSLEPKWETWIEWPKRCIQESLHIDDCA